MLTSPIDAAAYISYGEVFENHAVIVDKHTK